MTNRCIATFALIVGAMGIAGCGSEPSAPTLVKVSGKVMQNGQPLSKASIAFLPTDGKGREDFAVLEGGEYKIDLIPGKYKVVIEPEWVRKASKVGRTTIPAKYQDAAKTDLSADVEKAKGGLDFDLK